MAEVHAIVAPSSAQRWAGQCPGSALVEARNPETERTQEALEGDAAHWVGAETLRSMKQHGQSRTIAAGEKAPNGVVITDEMVDAAGQYVDYVLEHCNDMSRLHIEEKISIPRINPHSEGTPDSWWNPAPPFEKTVYVPDFKYGHRFVEVNQNLQLVNYSAKIIDMVPDVERWVFAVIQPRSYTSAGPIRTWTATTAELLPLFEKLRVAAATAVAPGAPTLVGEECWDCRGRHECAALSRATMAALTFAGNTVPLKMTPDALGLELRMLEHAETLIGARKTGIAGQVEALLKSQQSVPGWELNRTKPREQWAKDPAEIFVLGDMLNKDLRKPPAAITPPQARKLLGRALENVVAVGAGYVVQPLGALKLEQTNTTLATRIFSK